MRESVILPVGPSLPERLAARALQAGLVAAVLAASIRRTYELDRFLVPKELALHLTALVAGTLALGAIRRMARTRADLFLFLFVVLSGVSALFATNRWLGLRAFAVSASAVLIFWTARALGEAGLSRPILNGLAVAVVAVAGTSLLQAYGIRIDLFSENRSPGGTLGNRNSVAHVAALGLPLVLFAAIQAQRRVAIAYAGVAIVCASLVLTRSRAAYLASAVMLLVFFGALVLTHAPVWKRVSGAMIAAAIGIVAALVIPNTLRWNSDNPYLESVKGVVDYDSGSGRGRLVQYQHSLMMAARHPIFGVGPANWPVEYPGYAARNDPSLDQTRPGMTANPWPSSDWIAFVAERGLVATILLGLAILLIARNGITSPVLLATLAGALVAGAFDAVLLLALPALIVWMAAGVLSPTHDEQAGRMPAPHVVFLILIAAIGVWRSIAQLASMEIYATRGDRGSLERAARIDPGNFRVRLALARFNCKHARAALDQFPHSEAARNLARRCTAGRR